MNIRLPKRLRTGIPTIKNSGAMCRLSVCAWLFLFCTMLSKKDDHHRNEQSVAHYSNPIQIVWEKILKYNEYSRKMLKSFNKSKKASK